MTERSDDNLYIPPKVTRVPGVMSQAFGLSCAPGSNAEGSACAPNGNNASGGSGCMGNGNNA